MRTTRPTCLCMRRCCRSTCRQWPTSTSADLARHWLGKLRESQAAWADAIAAYQTIAPDAEQVSFTAVLESPHFAGIVAWRRNHPAGSLERGPGRRSDAILRSAHPGSRTKVAGVLERAQCAAVLVTARWRLDYLQNEYVNAQRVLQAALQRSPDADPAWRESAQSLLIVVLAAEEDQQDAARQLLEQLGARPPPSAGCDQRSVVRRSAGGTVRQATPRAIPCNWPRWIDWPRGPCNSTSNNGCGLIRSAPQACGPPGAAANAAPLQRLADSDPDNGRVQMEFAELLLKATILRPRRWRSANGRRWRGCADTTLGTRRSIRWPGPCTAAIRGRIDPPPASNCVISKPPRKSINHLGGAGVDQLLAQCPSE